MSYRFYLEMIGSKRRNVETMVRFRESETCKALGVANGKCETLGGRETSVFLCEPETFRLFRLRDRDFKVF